MLITKRVEFSASHVCRNPLLSDSENHELFGAAANSHGHGHNYVIEVTMEGQPDPVTGMVLDLKTLKDVVNREVISQYDHRFLNYEVQPFDRSSQNSPAPQVMPAQTGTQMGSSPINRHEVPGIAQMKPSSGL